MSGGVWKGKNKPKKCINFAFLFLPMEGRTNLFKPVKTSLTLVFSTPTVVQREHCFFPVFYPVFGDIFWQSDRMNPKLFASCRATHGRHFEYSCYGGLTNQKNFLSIWKKVFSSFLLLFHVYQTSLRDQYFRFRSSKNKFFIRLVQDLAFYGPDDHNFYFKVTPWPYTKSEICIWCGCKALRAAWRTGKQSFSVQNRLKLVEMY